MAQLIQVSETFLLVDPIRGLVPLLSFEPLLLVPQHPNSLLPGDSPL